MSFIVFDLDQTLILAEEKDWELWVLSCGEALGIDIARDQDWASYPIHTDIGLLEGISQRQRGRGVTDAERKTYERTLFARLDAVLAGEPGLFVPVDGAAEMLAQLARPAGIATGNLRWATDRKLISSGLDRFRLPCVCSEDGVDRPALVRLCLQRLGWQPGQRAISVGDGEWDVAAARALGIAFVGIAQTAVKDERLRASGAQVVLRDFTDIAAFHAALDAAVVPA